MCDHVGGFIVPFCLWIKPRYKHMNEVCRMFMWHYLLPCKKNMDGINFHSYMYAVTIPNRNRSHVEMFPCGTVFILSTYFFFFFFTWKC